MYNPNFPILHWFFTIVGGVMLFFLLGVLMRLDFILRFDFPVFFLIVFLSAIISTPSILIYTFIYFRLIKKVANVYILKLIMISFTIFAIIISLLILKILNSNTYPLAFSFSAAAILVAIVLPMKVAKTDS